MNERSEIRSVWSTQQASLFGAGFFDTGCWLPIILQTSDNQTIEKTSVPNLFFL